MSDVTKTPGRESVPARIRFTIAAIAIYELGLHVPLPGVDPEALRAAVRDAAGNAFGSYDLAFHGTLLKAAILSLGIVPYLTAATTVLLLSGVVPYLRRLRDGTVEGHVAFDRIIDGVTAAIALLQGFGLAAYLQSRGFLVRDPGVAFVLETVVITATGAVFLAWLARQVTRRGIVNGIALIVFIDLVRDALSGITVEAGALPSGALLSRQFVLFILGTGGLFALCLYMVKAERRLPLRYAGKDARSRTTPSWVPSIALRMNTVGVVPVALTAGMLRPLYFVGLTRGTVLSWIVSAGLIVFFTYLWTAFTFSGTDVSVQLRRYGFEFADADLEKQNATGEHLDRIMERLAALHAAFLVALVVIVPLFLVRLGIRSELSWIAGPSLLVIAAIGVAIMNEIRPLGQEGDETRDPAVEWVPIFESETELEVDLARNLLERRGIPTRRSSNRAVPITGTLAFWEMSRPPFPSVTIHRRLGGGTVCAEVPASEVERAESALASIRGSWTRV